MKKSFLYLVILVIFLVIIGYWTINVNKANKADLTLIKKEIVNGSLKNLKDMDDMEKILLFTKILAIKNNQDVDNIFCDLTIESTNHIKGIFRTKDIEGINNFYAVKIDNIWEIVYQGLDENINCQNLEIYNFPGPVLSTCY